MPGPRRPWPAIGSRCTGCGRCVAACDPHVLWLDVTDGRKRAVLHDAPGCTGCSLCARVCPFDAIAMQPARAAGADATPA
ncbi:MAG: 4Fe-4S dicluster domain-containing protein [Rubrivivax sp.]